MTLLSRTVLSCALALSASSALLVGCSNDSGGSSSPLASGFGHDGDADVDGDEGGGRGCGCSGREDGDHTFDESSHRCDGGFVIPVGRDGCVPKTLDTNGDGHLDSVDLDCDGVADAPM